MKKYLILILLLSVVTGLKAQFLMDINGRAVVTKNYSEINGNPYYNSEWTKGKVKLEDGTVYTDLYLKYNQVDEEVYFKSKDGEPLSFLKSVSEFSLTQPGNDVVSFIKDVPGGEKNKYYEVLAKGSVTLLKCTIKTIISVTEYNATMPTKTVDVNEKYFLLTNGKLIKIKNDKKSLLSQLTPNSGKVEAYVASNKVDFKKDKDLASVIIYYNSL